MTYWLNVHDPDRIGDEDDYKVYLKLVHNNTARLKIQEGDLAAIYEIGWERGNTVIGTDGSTWPLKEGRKGIVAIIRLASFQYHPYTYNGTQYIGWCDIAEVINHGNSTPLISLHELQERWFNRIRKHFNPRINGGLRELDKNEWRVILDSIGA